MIFQLIRVAFVVLTHVFTLYLMGERRDGIDHPLLLWSSVSLIPFISGLFVIIAERRARVEGVKFEKEIEVPETIPLKDQDLVTLVANILDNALYSTSGAKSGFVKFSLSYREDLLKIEMRNSLFSPIAFDSEGLPISSKINGGIGMRNVRRVVSKYKGMMRCFERDGEFVTQIVICC